MKSIKKDRILVVIDEASIFYIDKPRIDLEVRLVIEARTLVDNIGKLSRTSAINLLFTKQKLERQIIPTWVSENSGRVIFRANTLQLSMVASGN